MNEDTNEIHFPSSQEINDFMRPPHLKEINPLKVLPDDQFVDVPLKKVDGDIVWLNWDLIEEVDPRLRALKRNMTPALKKTILDRYCLMVDETPAKSRQENREIILGHADKYADRGAGRACTIEGGINIKGIGRTSLAPPLSVGTHNDGYVGFEESVLEAVAGEVCAELLKNHSTRTLAVIAPKIPWYQKDKEPHPLKTLPRALRMRLFKTASYVMKNLGIEIAACYLIR